MQNQTAFYSQLKLTADNHEFDQKFLNHFDPRTRNSRPGIVTFSLLAIWIEFTRSLAYWQEGGKGDQSLPKIVSYRNSNQSRTIVIHRDRAFQSHTEINDTFLPLLLKYFLFYPVLVVFSCCIHVVSPAVATKRLSIAFPCLFFVLSPLRSIEQFHSLSNFFCLATLFLSRYLSFLVRSTIPQKRLALLIYFASSIDSSLESWTIEYESFLNLQVFVEYDGRNSRIYQNKFPREKFCQSRGHCINRSTIFKDLDSIAIFSYISLFLPTRDT